MSTGSLGGELREFIVKSPLKFGIVALKLGLL
jgi:hypothetical protein